MQPDRSAQLTRAAGLYALVAYGPSGALRAWNLVSGGGSGLPDNSVSHALNVICAATTIAAAFVGILIFFRPAIAKLLLVLMCLTMLLSLATTVASARPPGRTSSNRVFVSSRISPVSYTNQLPVLALVWAVYAVLRQARNEQLARQLPKSQPPAWAEPVSPQATPVLAYARLPQSRPVFRLSATITSVLSAAMILSSAIQLAYQLSAYGWVWPVAGRIVWNTSLSVAHSAGFALSLGLGIAALRGLGRGGPVTHETHVGVRSLAGALLFAGLLSAVTVIASYAAFMRAEELGRWSLYAIATAFGPAVLVWGVGRVGD